MNIVDDLRLTKKPRLELSSKTNGRETPEVAGVRSGGAGAFPGCAGG